MKISGFTILQRAVSLGYPFVESVRSLLPLVDELVVAVGEADDGTLEAVAGLQEPKIRVLRTAWDPAARQFGVVLSQQTNRALSECGGDWAVYLQADEVLHEDDLDRLHAALRRHWHRRTEGLLFDYLHFYGSYGVVQDHRRRWYSRAVRAVKTRMGIRSVGDACGFRVQRGTASRGLLKARSGARIFHYGWCQPPEVILTRKRNLAALFHDDAWIATRFHDSAVDPQRVFDDRGHLATFRGRHPAVMQARVAAEHWPFDAGLEQQWPAWLRHAYVRFVYPLRSHRGGDQRLVPLRLANVGWRLVDAWWRLRARMPTRAVRR